MEIRIKLNTVKNAMLFATVCDNYEEDMKLWIVEE